MGKIIVLGAGNMGAYIASNLSKNYDVTIADYSEESLDKITAKVDKKQANLKVSKVVTDIISDFDLVVSALPEDFGYEALSQVILAKKNVVDISFWKQSKERLAGLNHIAKEKKVTAFIDCGVAPGFGSVVGGYFDILLNKNTKNLVTAVGGVSKNPKEKFTSTWSPAGLIEEYQRPALRVVGGFLDTVPALSISKNMTFENVGTLEAAITDGLRSIAFSLGHVFNMAEFTLRYPGHFDQMRQLQELGYFKEAAVDVGQNSFSVYDLSKTLLNNVSSKNGYESTLKELGFFNEKMRYLNKDKNISPKKVALDVLSKTWKPKPNFKDILVLRVSADDNITKHTADVYAESNGVDSAMAITTGGMASLAAEYLISEEFKKGVFPLEKAVKVQPILMQYFTDGLKDLGVKYSYSKEKLK